MHIHSENIEALIAKVLSKEASTSEIESLQIWLDQSASNQQYFDQLVDILNQTNGDQNQPNFDSEQAWEQVEPKLTLSSQDSIRTSRFNPWIYRIAAGVAILLGVLYFFKPTNESIEQQMSLSSENTVEKDSLPDGTFTVLNKNSALSYSFDAKSNTRKVQLNGEAFFEIKSQQNQAFIIEAHEVFIEDIGTAFNVQAYPNSDTVLVQVEHGEVKLYTNMAKGLHVLAGQTGIYDRKKQEFYLLENSDPNLSAYASGIYAFNNTPLHEVIATLNEAYEPQRISLANEALGRCRITVRFKNESLAAIVEIIAATFQLTVNQQNGEFILDGKDCKN